jgi:hypothetical protein
MRGKDIEEDDAVHRREQSACDYEGVGAVDV